MSRMEPMERPPAPPELPGPNDLRMSQIIRCVHVERSIATLDLRVKGFVSPTVKPVPHAVFLQTTGRDFTSGDILARAPVVGIPGHRVRILESFVFIFFQADAAVVGRAAA